MGLPGSHWTPEACSCTHRAAEVPGHGPPPGCIAPCKLIAPRTPTQLPASAGS